MRTRFRAPIRGCRPRKPSKDGFSLLELMIAAALFLIVIGGAAQVLVSYYAAMQSQNFRVAAVGQARGLLHAMRSVRTENPNRFPDAILERWPNNFTRENLPELPGGRLLVTYDDANANPLEVTVDVSWNTPGNQRAAMRLTTLLTDR